MEKAARAQHERAVKPKVRNRFTAEQIKAMLANTDPEIEYPPEVAGAFLGGISTVTLGRMRRTGGGPRFTRLTRNRVTYKRRHLIEWKDQRTFSSTSDETSMLSTDS